MINEAPRRLYLMPTLEWLNQLGGEVINYPTLSIKSRGYQLSHVINYPLDNLSNEPIMENRPNYVLDQPYGTPPSPVLYH